MSIKRKNIVVIGLLISAVFLYLALRQVEWNQVGLLLAGTNYFLLIPATLVFFTDFFLRAFRWNFLISPVKKCSFKNLTSSIFIGFFANTIFPMRAGEIVRSFCIGRQEKISKMSALATIAVERVLDGFTILSILVLTYFIFPFEPVVRNILLMGVFFFTLCAISFYGLLFYRDLTRRILDKALNLLPGTLKGRISVMLDSFINGLSGMRSRQIIPAVLLSACSWSVNAGGFLLIARGMGLEVTFAGAAFMMSVVALGIAIPSSPGYIGVFEYFGVLSGTLIGLSRSDAVGLILLIRAIQTLLILSTGGFFFARENLTVLQLKKSVAAAD